MSHEVKTPTLDEVFSKYVMKDYVAHLHDKDLHSGYIELTALKAENTRLRTELASAEQNADTWKALAQAHEAKVVKPVRKLREVKIGGYDALFRWNNDRLEAKVGYPEHWVAQGRIRTEWLDEVNELRANPYEPVETVEAVLREAYNVLGVSKIILPEFHEHIIDRLRTAVHAEGAA